MEAGAPHQPVLMEEVLSFIVRPGVSLVLDATIGAGGHAEAILKSMEKVKLIGLDRDQSAVALSGRRLAPFAGRATVAHADFSSIGRVLDEAGFPKVDAALMDLGVSSMQLDQPERGFSFGKPGPLDMRMDQSTPITAAMIVNTYDEKELTSIFRLYGEESKAPRIARAIIGQRAMAPITTTDRLARIIEQAAPAPRGRIHPATRVFQALRIAVNSELDLLAMALDEAVERLNPGGRIVVISFHSLEDRIVKRAFMDMAKGCVCPKQAPVCVCGGKPKVKLLTRKPVMPQEAEIAANPRARSARLRAAERVAA